MGRAIYNQLETQIGTVHYIKMQRSLIEIGQAHAFSERIQTVARPALRVGMETQNRELCHSLNSRIFELRTWIG